MTPQRIANEVQKRRTAAIVSHPDAGKTTLTSFYSILAYCAAQAWSKIKGWKTGYLELDGVEQERAFPLPIRDSFPIEIALSMSWIRLAGTFR